jgi:hypothetical protein
LFFCVAAALVAQPALSQPPQAATPPPPDEEFIADVTGGENSVFSVAVPVFATPHATASAAGIPRRWAGRSPR